MRGKAPIRASDRGNARRPRGARRPQRPVCSFRAQGARACGAERAQAPFRLSGNRPSPVRGVGGKVWKGRFHKAFARRCSRMGAHIPSPLSPLLRWISCMKDVAARHRGNRTPPDILHAAYLNGSAVAASLWRLCALRRQIAWREG